MKIALVHDDLVQWGGAERVLLAISDLFPEAPIYTSVFNRSNKVLATNFEGRKIISSFIQRIPAAKNLYRPLLPVYPIAFEQFDFSGYDVVISQTTKFAKAIITKPKTKHICYCHTPPRFLWNFSGEEVPALARPLIPPLRVFDQISSNRVDQFWAGSKNAQQRIKSVYQRESEVLYPFVDLNRFKGIELFDGGYYLIVARLNKYKRVDLAVDVFNKLGLRLIVVGSGPEKANLVRRSKGNIKFLSGLDDETVTRLISGCRALIVTAEEDFGLTPLEAQALGKPVLAYGVGGARETVINKKTGIFFDSQTIESLTEAVLELDSTKILSNDCVENASRFSKEIFQKNLVNMLR